MKNKIFDIKILIIGLIFSLLVSILQVYKYKELEKFQTKNIGIILTNKLKVKLEILEDITEFLKRASITRNGKLSREDFCKISKFLYTLYNANEISGIFYLKGGKIEYIYPLEGNVGTLGMNIFEQEDKKEDAFFTLKKKETVVSGPYNLYQGGKGLVVRNPIFLEDNGKDKFIGFSVVVARFPDFILNMNLDEVSNYNYKISTVSNGEEKIVASSGKKMKSPKVFDIEILNNIWKIELEPINFFNEFDNIFLIFLSLVIFTLMVSNLSYRYKEKNFLLEEIELEKELLMVALENSNMVIFTYDDETGKIIFRNRKYFIEEYNNCTEIYLNVLDKDLTVEEGKDKLIEIFSLIKGGRKSAFCEIKKKNLKHGYMWEKITLLNPFVDKYGMRKIIGIIENITELKEKELKLEKEGYHKIAIKEGSIFYLEGNITKNMLVTFNLESYEETKLEYDKFIKKYIDNNVHINDREWVKNVLVTKECNKRYFKYKINTFSIEYQYLYNKEYIWVRSNIYFTYSFKTNELSMVVVTRDINKEKVRELMLVNQAERDTLTGLYNRETIKNKINNFLIKNTSSAFFLLDLDNFKSINDNYGHSYGDCVLEETAKILLDNFREEDLIARLGGDEFVIFMKDIKSSETIERKAKILKEKLKREYKEKGKRIEISASIGVVITHNITRDFDDLYLAADKVMYEVKNQNKDGYKIITSF